MAIDVKDIQRLRTMTGVGMTDAKKALDAFISATTNALKRHGQSCKESRT